MQKNSDINKEINFFFDLDETLVHSLYSHKKDELEYWMKKDYRSDGIVSFLTLDNYVTYVRSFARELINWTRNLFGNENVYLLTYACGGYARDICRKAGFGFRDDQIHSARDIELVKYPKTSPIFPKRFLDSINILVDDIEFAGHSEGKAKYLNLDSSNLIRTHFFINTERSKREREDQEFIRLKIAIARRFCKAKGVEFTGLDQI